MKKLLKPLAIIVAFTYLTGCSSFRPATQNIMFYATKDGQNVPGPVLVVNGKPYRLPATIAAKRSKILTYRYENNEHRSVFGVVDSGLNLLGIIDIIGGVLFILPFFGLAFPGAYSLDADKVEIQLMEKE